MEEFLQDILSKMTEEQYYEVVDKLESGDLVLDNRKLKTSVSWGRKSIPTNVSYNLEAVQTIVAKSMQR